MVGFARYGAEKVPRDPHRGVLTCGAGFTRDSYSHPSPSRRGLLLMTACRSGPGIPSPHHEHCRDYWTRTSNSGRYPAVLPLNVVPVVPAAHRHAASSPGSKRRKVIDRAWVGCVMRPCTGRLLALTGDYALPFTNHPSRWDIVKGEPSRPASENTKSPERSPLGA